MKLSVGTPRARRLRRFGGAHLAAALLLLCATSTSIQAEPPPVVAVFEIEDATHQLKPQSIRQLTAYFRVKLTESAGLVLIPATDLERALKEQKADSYKQCYDQSCQIEVGKALAAQKVLYSQIVRIAGQCVVTATLFDLRLGATETAASHKGDCGEGALVESIERVVMALGGVVSKTTGPTGGLFIKSSPAGAKVRVDGNLVKGHTPLTLEKLAIGKHVVEVLSGDRGKTVTVRIKENGFVRLNLALDTLTALVKVVTEPPEVIIELDGRRVGQTPLVLPNVFYGTHRLRLSKKSYVTQQLDLVVPADKVVTRRLQKAAYLKISSMPPGARISVNGKSVGTAPLSIFLAPGDIRIVTTLDGYQTQGRTLTISDATTVSFKLDETSKRTAERARIEASLVDYQTQKSSYLEDSSNGFGWLGLLGGIASGAGAAALYLGAINAQSDYDNGVDFGTLDQAAGRASSFEAGGHALAGMMIVGVGFAIYEWTSAPEEPLRPATPSWFRSTP